MYLPIAIHSPKTPLIAGGTGCSWAASSATRQLLMCQTGGFRSDIHAACKNDSIHWFKSFEICWYQWGQTIHSCENVCMSLLVMQRTFSRCFVEIFHCLRRGRKCYREGPSATRLKWVTSFTIFHQCVLVCVLMSHKIPLDYLEFDHIEMLLLWFNCTWVIHYVMMISKRGRSLYID